MDQGEARATCLALARWIGGGDVGRLTFVSLPGVYIPDIQVLVRTLAPCLPPPSLATTGTCAARPSRTHPLSGRYRPARAIPETRTTLVGKTKAAVLDRQKPNPRPEYIKDPK